LRVLKLRVYAIIIIIIIIVIIIIIIAIVIIIIENCVKDQFFDKKLFLPGAAAVAAIVDLVSVTEVAGVVVGILVGEGELAVLLRIETPPLKQY
jgi:hypothetical protein